MLLDSRTIVQQVGDLHAATVDRWHHQPLNNPYTGLLAVVCQQHQYNFQLWHQEDLARCPQASDEKIAQVKRAIDGFNQQRNDFIERTDETLVEMLAAAGVLPSADATLNTETPGSAIDRLSIMALRIFHLEEELERPDVDDTHRQRVTEKLRRCRIQRSDLSTSLEELLSDVFTGRKLLRVYRQMKLYNDPTLNPAVYGAKRAG